METRHMKSSEKVKSKLKLRLQNHAPNKFRHVGLNENGGVDG